jgi:hypothetical protein
VQNNPSYATALAAMVTTLAELAIHDASALSVLAAGIAVYLAIHRANSTNPYRRDSDGWGDTPPTGDNPTRTTTSQPSASAGGFVISEGEPTMSKETLQHLNTNTLIGNTDARGHAWHYRAEEQGTETNHYPGPIPVADVQRRLFYWEAESRRIAVEVPTSVDSMTHLTADGTPARWAVVEDRQAICRSDDDTGAVMGIFAPGYTRHQYAEWLLTTVANILDDDLAISSAGLLNGGATAWVEVSVPHSITTPEGVTFRPTLLATSSFDGSTPPPSSARSPTPSATTPASPC